MVNDERSYFMRSIIFAAAALLGAVALPAAAMARPGYVTATVNMRAGPGTDFPAVDRVPRGARVDIHGCVSGYRWCDVTFAGNRGWVVGDELEFLYRGRRVTVFDYGPEIDFPIIGFDVGTYWGHYYRHRDFYGRRDNWEHRDGRHRDEADRDRRRGGDNHVGRRDGDHRDRGGRSVPQATGAAPQGPGPGPGARSPGIRPVPNTPSGGYWGGGGAAVPAGPGSAVNPSPGPGGGAYSR
jgi:uncharacterized protein YraI